ncbi:MAG: hypothetical protein M3486_10285, partial [Actinomycetota bacterium]|nr:hypothetical protein [Actinomycetota bacterium]
GLLLGGTLRGLTTLAAANLLWFLLLVLGGVLFPLSAFGPAEPVLSLLPTAALSGGLRGVLFPLSAFGAAEPVLSLLPTAALSTGLREVLSAGEAPWREAVALAGWAVASLAAASRAFRWE